MVTIMINKNKNYIPHFCIAQGPDQAISLHNSTFNLLFGTVKGALLLQVINTQNFFYDCESRYREETKSSD